MISPRDHRRKSDSHSRRVLANDYRLAKRAERALQPGEHDGEYGLKPGTDAGSGKSREPKKERMQELIDRLNDLLGAEADVEDKLKWTQNLADRFRRNDEVMQEAPTDSPDQMMRARYPDVPEQIAIYSMNDHESLATKALEILKTWNISPSSSSH